MIHVSTGKNLYYPVSERRMVRGSGVRLYDSDGNAFIDCAAATFNLSLGYSHPEVLEAMREQADKLIHVTSSFRTDPIDALAHNLAAVAPDGLSLVNPKVGGGSEANEGAIKMAQRATGRSQVITLFRAHVGQTLMMSSMSGNAFRREPFPVELPGSLQVPDPYCHRCFYDKSPESCGRFCVDKIDDFIEFASTGRVAAILVEPISGNGGNIVPPEGYFQKLRELCDRHDIMLIFDEIQTGIGRTGHMFAAQHFGVTPDAITTAKGLGGIGAQVAAIITTERMGGLPSDQHSFTYGSNLLAAAAANKTLEIVGRPEFLANVRATGAHIMGRLAQIAERFPFVGDVRGVGLMIGFEIVGPGNAPDVARTNALAQKAMEHGLILRTSRYGRGNVLKIRPPLILTLDEAEEICERLERLFSAEAA
ncbi:aspartate aminotransferase family protein [Salinarimonas chemoclinalis]|uniref:aspartate aminotransferase family protein n=1 Tax=Salinarimonas chemoclinalis TaxID=3241599 RepID=UPI00355754A9